MMRRKSQIVSTDMIYGLIAFIILIAIFLSVFFYGQFTKGVDKYDYEMDYVFNNIEMNSRQLPASEHFISGSRVFADKLDAFYAANTGSGIDDVVVGNVGEANGIGLDPAAYAACLYFTDIDNAILQIGETRYLGQVKDGSCQEVIDSGKNPCDGYSKATSLLKPVLYDEGDASKNRILQMNIVLCEI